MSKQLSHERNRMRRAIPSLATLQGFEAAGRLQSFSHAANELCVTQGAISKQIKLLEVGKDCGRRASACEYTVVLSQLPKALSYRVL